MYSVDFKRALQHVVHSCMLQGLQSVGCGLHIFGIQEYIHYLKFSSRLCVAFVSFST